jgi:hypothetical protein
LDCALAELRPFAIALNTVGVNRDTQGYEQLANAIALLSLGMLAYGKKTNASEHSHNSRYRPYSIGCD